MVDKQSFDKDIIISFYHETWNEIARLRDFEWTIGYYFSSIAGALIFLSTEREFGRIVTPFISLLLSAFQLVSMVFAAFYLILHHHYLTQFRKVRGMLENLLALNEIRDSKGQHIMPTTWQGARVSFTFQLRSIVLPIMFAVLGMQAFSIYMVGQPFWSWLGHCTWR